MSNPIAPKPPERNPNAVAKEKLKIIIDDKDKVTVYMDGKEVKGVRSISFDKSADTYAKHRIEYVTCAAGHVDIKENE